MCATQELPPEDGEGGGGIAGFRGQKRRNDTHQSTADADSRLYRKSSNNDGARLAYLGHVMTENRHGLIVDTRFTQADGYAERAAAASRMDALTTRHSGYEVSQRKRPLIEKVFSWLKGIATLRKTRHRGTERVGWMFALATAVYNLVRMRRLLPAAVQCGSKHAPRNTQLLFLLLSLASSRVRQSRFSLST